MIPTNLYNEWTDQGCQSYFGGVLEDNLPGTCSDVMEKVSKIAVGLDIYDLYRESNDVYLEGKKERAYGESIVGGRKLTYK